MFILFTSRYACINMFQPLQAQKVSPRKRKAEISPRRHKRGPASKLENAYFPDKLYRVLSQSKHAYWSNANNIAFVDYGGFINEWKEIVGEIKEQTLKDELRKHGFVRSTKLERCKEQVCVLIGVTSM